MKKVCILNFTCSSNNWGLNACSLSLKEEILKHTNSVELIDYSLIHSEYLFDHFSLFGKERFFPLGKYWIKRFFPKSLKIPRVCDEFRPLLDCWTKGDGGINSNKIISSLATSDIVYFNAEGSCYRKNYGARTGLYLLWLSRVFLGKQAIFVNGNITVNSVDNVLQSMLLECKSVGVDFVVRDKLSLKNMQEMDLEVDYCPDSAFAAVNSRVQVSKSFDEKINGYGQYFCVSKSMLDMSQMPIGDTGLDAFALFIRHIQQLTGWNPVFLAKDSEDLYIKKYVNLISGSHVAPEILGSAELLSVIRKCKLLVSGRYHHLIFGMCSGVPLLPLDTTSPKIRGLLVDTPYSNLILDPTSLTNSLDKVQKLLSQVFLGHKVYDSYSDSKYRYLEFSSKIKSHLETP